MKQKGIDPNKDHVTITARYRGKTYGMGVILDSPDLYNEDKIKELGRNLADSMGRTVRNVECERDGITQEEYFYRKYPEERPI